jgi:hypothetical protein
MRGIPCGNCRIHAGECLFLWVGPFHKPSHSPIFHVCIRRENSSIRPPKQPFLSLSTYISPSGKRSAIQKRPLAYISEPALCRIQQNGAHPEVSQNMCAGIQRICAGMGTMTLSWRGGLRRRSEVWGEQVPQGQGRNVRSSKQGFFSF